MGRGQAVRVCTKFVFKVHLRGEGEYIRASMYDMYLIYCKSYETFIRLNVGAGDKYGKPSSLAATFLFAYYYDYSSLLHF